MRKTLLLALSVALIILSNKAFAQTWVEKMQDPTVNFYDVQKAFNDYFDKGRQKQLKEEQKHELREIKEMHEQEEKAAKTGRPLKSYKKDNEEERGEVPNFEVYKRWEDQMKFRLFPSGDRSVMINAWNDYLDNFEAERMAASHTTRAASSGSTPTIASANWAMIGPTTTIPAGGGAGRVNFIRWDPTNSNIIYVGSPAGGLWKSTTGGTGWTTNTDNLAVIGCTDLVINPLNTQIMYLAIGDGEAQDTYSTGVLKSIDGGATWNPSGLNWTVTLGRTISKLLINPQNPNTLFAGTSNGVYRSNNAGASWTQIATAVANIKDMEFRPGDTTTVYACSTTQFYKSTNGGTSFVTTATGLPATTAVSRLAIGVTANDPTYVYVVGAIAATGSANDYGFQGIYLSTNNGTSFTTKATTPNLLGFAAAGTDQGGQGWYTLSIAVSPTNKAEVLVGGVNIWRSTNSGANWTLNAQWTGSGAPYVHADIHALEYFPGSGTSYFAGCDGGCFKTTNSGTAWTDLSNGLNISEAYRLGNSVTNNNLLVTGWQDNGTNRWSGTSTWNYIQGGDGMEALVDWSNANIQYGELYYGQINKTTTGGNLTTSIVASGGTGVNANGDWVTPYIEAPSNAATLFVGKAQVYKSTNSGGTWAQVGTISGGTGNVIALANAASNINYVYAAKVDKFYACTTGSAFVDRTAGLPVTSAAITYIAVHPTNPSRVWVTFSGYSAANKVWYSPDAGVTWTNYTTGLPNLPANCIVVQKGAVNVPLYVGTDVGVYYRDSISASWVNYSSGLPNVIVKELEIQYGVAKLRAATFGRGMWQSDLYSPGAALPIADFTVNRTNICVGDCINFTDLSTGSPTSWSWSFPGAATTTSTIQNPTNICYNTPGTYAVTLIATNVNGSNTKTKTAYITVSAPVALPLVEGFQAAFVPSGWYLNNPDADMTWAQSTTVGGFTTSTSSAFMDNYSPTTTIAGTVDELWTPKYSFASVATATMTFDVSYARYNATYFDSLIVYVSTNCGSTWSRVYAKGGTSLKTSADDSTSAFVPTTSAQWRTETVNMTPYAGQANVSVKFQNKSGWGQILYLDNVNITGTGAPVASVVIAETAGTNPMCAGASATFTATPTNGGTTPSYQWQVNGANVGTNSPTYTTTTLTSGQIVTCIMTSSLGGVTGSPATSNAITMTVNPLPATPTASNTGPYCAGTTITLSTPTVAGATYSWTGPSSFTSSLQNPTRTGATTAMAGTYSVTVTSAAGCTSTAGTTTVVVNAVPAAPTAGSNSPVCAGSPINLTATTVAGAAYSWTGPSSYTSSLQNPAIPSATTAMAGTYSVTVTVSGCTSTAATTAVVVNAIPATPAAGSNSPVCAGATINLTTPTVAGATYSWTGPSAYSAAVQNPSLTGATGTMAGTYSVTVTTGGCTSLAGTTTVVVNPIPATPTATNTGPYCVGGTITLNTPTVAGATYSWSGPASFTSTVQNPTRPGASAAMAGTYSVTVTSASGCTSLAGTTTVVINPLPATPTASNTGPYCAGGTIALSTPTVAGATYAWSGPSAYSSSVQNPTRPGATVAMSGTYSVTVTTGGCTSLAGTTAVVVNAIPATPTASNTGPFCAGTTISLNTPTVAGASYSWTGPGAYTSSVQNATRPGATTAMAGTYSVTVTTGGCTSAAGTTTVVVNAAPATPVPSINGSTTPAAICAGGTITLTTPTVAGATYSWSGPNSYSSAVRNPPALTSATTLMSGTYSLTVTVGGCTSAAGTVSIVVNPIPATPTASNTGPYCTGATIALSTPTVAGATYSWSGPSAYSSAVQNATRTGATGAMAGTYSVTVTVSGCTSLPGTTAVAVSSSVTPGVTVAAVPSGAICAGTSVTFTATPAGGGTAPSYQWQVNGSNAGTNSPTFTSATLTSGQVVTCILTSSSACATPTTATSTGITMTVNPSVTPTISITPTPAGAICAGTSVMFTATITNGGSTPSYQWQINGANAGTSLATFSSSTFNNGDVITCILTSNAACASPATVTSTPVTMVVNPVVAPADSIFASPAGPICAGTSVTFTAIPTNGGTTPTYQWQVNGSNVGTGSSTFTSSALNDADVITCIMTSGAPCASPASSTSNAVTMTVTPTVAPAVSIAITSGGSTMCSGQSATFTATIANGGTTPSYQWQVNGSNAGTDSPTFTSATLNDGDVVTCILTSNATCASPASVTSSSITMTVNPTPAAPTITVSGAVLTSSSPTGNQWYLDGVLIPGATGQTYTTTSNGTYTVIVTTGGCSSTSSAGTNVTNTGIDQAGNPNLLDIFPNPSDGNFTVSFNSLVKANYKLELIDALGQLVYKDVLTDFSGTYSKQLSVVEYGKGVYTITLTNDKKEIIKKIIVY